MSGELAVFKGEQRIAVAQVAEFNSTQVQLLRDTIAQGCDPNEFQLFLEMAKAKRLNPFDGQIRPVKRWDSVLRREKMTVQVGIDGYRAIASRTGELAGIDDPVYDSDADQPKWAKVTVYRYGRGNDKNPFTATARWSEYVQRKKPEEGESVGKPNAMWTKMPCLMLGKVAEALALRKAFPDELGGVYTNEEMAQADNVVDPQQTRPQVEMSQAKAPNSYVLSQGTITARKDGKDGALWVIMRDKIIAIPADKVSAYPFNVGDSMTFDAIEKKGKEKDFWLLNEVKDYKVNDDDPLPPMEDGPAKSKPKDEMDKAMASGQLEEPIGDLEETRTGKMGRSREVRLYTLMTQNKDKTGLTRDIVHEILNKMDPPVAHLSDLDKSFFTSWERLMKGEDDWKTLI